MSSFVNPSPYDREKAKPQGRRYIPQASDTLEGEDYDTIALRKCGHSSIRHNNLTNSQTTDAPVVCGVPTRRANGMSNMTSQASEEERFQKMASSPRVVSRINDGQSPDALFNGAVEQGDVFKGGKATFGGRNTAGKDLPARPIRSFAQGSTTLTFSN